MTFQWNEEKNRLLREERGVCFEDVVLAIHEDRLLTVIPHPNNEKYPDQKLYVVEIGGYAYMAPFVRNDDGIFLKTVIPSRKMTRLYVKGKNDEPV